MQDNKNHIGSNWTGRTPRSVEEAGIRGQWSIEREQSVSADFRGSVACCVLMVVAFLLGMWV